MKQIIAILGVGLCAAASAQSGPSVNESTGDLTYVYGFTLPRARGNYQPSLALTYSSSSRRDSGYGYGWSLAESFVEIETRGKDRHVLSLNGSRATLIEHPAGTNTYRSEVERVHFTVTLNVWSTARWLAVDSVGTKYYFGEHGATCGTRWYLSRVEDLLGNRTTFTYHTNEAGCATHLTEIRYNLYGGASYATTVALGYQPATGIATQVVAGVLVQHGHRLATLRIKGASGATVRGYELAYDVSRFIRAHRLASITEIGGGFIDLTERPAGAVLPPTTFSYSDGEYRLRQGKNFGWPFAIDWSPEWIDVDSDGRTDAVLKGHWDGTAWVEQDTTIDSGKLVNDYTWARNTTARGTSVPTFAALAQLVAGHSEVDLAKRSPEKLVDFQGDGLLDAVRFNSSLCGGVNVLDVRLGQRDAAGVYSIAPGGLCIDASAIQTRLQQEYPCPSYDPQCPTAPPLLEGANMVFEDLNGDGVKDFAIRRNISQCGDGYATPCEWFTWLTDHESGLWRFTEGPVLEHAPGTSLTKAPLTSPPTQYPVALSMDVNGDGLADAVRNDANAWIASLNVWGTDTNAYMTNPFPWANVAPLADDPDVGGIADYVEYFCADCGTQSSGGDYLICSAHVEDTNRALAALADINGDGLTDYLRSRTCWDGRDCFVVTWGSGSAFEAYPESKLIISNPGTEAGVVHTLYPLMRNEFLRGTDASQCSYRVPAPGRRGEFVDITGDGITDYVYLDLQSSSHALWVYRGAITEPPQAVGAAETPLDVPGILLAGVTTPAGLTHHVRYAFSTAFGDPGEFRRPVVVELNVSGTALAPVTTRYWYADPVREIDWWDSLKYENRGFSKTWSQDSATGNVRYAEWATKSHALVGLPSIVHIGSSAGFASSYDPSTPPVFSAFKRTVFTHEAKKVGSGRGLGCLYLGGTQLPSLSDYPVRVVTTTVTESSLQGGVWSAMTTSTSCSDVDENGVVHRTETTPSIGSVNSATLVSEVIFDPPGAEWPCTSIAPVVETKTLERAPGATQESETVLQHQVAIYDDKCRITEEYAWDAEAKKKTNRTTLAYQGLSPVDGMFGQLSSSTSGGVTKYVAYDAQLSLYVTGETQDDGTAALTTEYEHDLDTGLRLRASGPRLTRKDGQPHSGPLGITRYYAYDSFGRPVATAKLPFNTVVDTRIPFVPPVTVANGLVELTEYRDIAVPRAVVTYRFATPASVAFPVDPTFSTSASDDVMVTIAYADAAGRPIQQRERLGGAALGATSSHVSQRLSGYRVASSVVYDAAGRTVAALDPFYDSGEGFRNYAVTGGLPKLRGTLTSFDVQGRPLCVSYQFIEGSIPDPTPGGDACASDSSDTASFALRTEYRYRSSDSSDGVEGLGPYGGSFVVVDTITPELNDRTSSTFAFKKLMGPNGEELGAIDPDGNRTWVQRDALGREIASWRDRATGPSTPKPLGGASLRSLAVVDAASWIRYNTAGQVVQTWDANAPTLTRDSYYDDAGRLIRLIVDSTSTKTDGVQYEYGPGGLGRVTSVLEVKGGVTTGRVIASNYYDEPYDAEDPGFCGTSDGSTCFIAGKLSWTQNEHTRIAYGYDDAARVWRRDQVFAKLDEHKRITMSSTYGADGRVLEATVVNPFDSSATLTYAVSYDSSGRPVSLAGGLPGRPTTTYYEAISQNAHGAYDALGRIAVMHADNVNGAGAQVRSARTYGQFSGMLLGEVKCLLHSGLCGTTPDSRLFETDGQTPGETTFLGRNLATFSDLATKTRYENTYSASGRLRSATATPDAGIVSLLTQDYIEDYTYDEIGNIAAITTTTDGSAASQQALRAKRFVNEVRTPVSPAPDRIVDKIDAIATSTFVNDVRTSEAPHTVEYTYDVEGHLTAITRDQNEVVERLFYGPSSELTHRQVGQDSVFYVGDYATITATGTADCTAACAGVATSVSLDAHIVVAGTRIASVKPHRTLYYYRSRLGSVVATSLNDGRVGATYRYTPYGAVDVALNESPDSASELGYTNALRLTGELLYLKNRVYDARGRVFIQPDVVDRLRYAYVWGNPVNYSDPTGMLPMANTLAPSDAYENATSAYNQLKDALTQIAEPASHSASSPGRTPADPSTEQAAHKDEVALQSEQGKAEISTSVKGTSKERLNLALKEARTFKPADATLKRNQARIIWSTEGFPDDPTSWRFALTEPVNVTEDGEPARKYVITIDFDEIDSFNRENQRRGSDYQMTDAEVVVHEVTHVRLYEKPDYGERKTESQRELPAYMAQDAYRRERRLDPLPSVMYDRYTRQP